MVRQELELSMQLPSLSRSPCTASAWPFAWPVILGASVGAVAITAVAWWFLGRQFVPPWGVPLTDLWPFSLLSWRASSPLESAALVLALTSHGALLLWSLHRRVAWHTVFVCGYAILLLFSLGHGVRDGIVQPVHEWGHGYPSELRSVESVGGFLSRFDEIQLSLDSHGRTHPPGAILVFYLLSGVSRDPVFLSLVLAALGWLVTSRYLWLFLRRELGDRLDPSRATVVFLGIPSVLIYTMTSLDGLIAGLMLGAAYHFLDPRGLRGVVPAWVCTTAASFITFGALWIVPVLAATELLSDRSVRRTAVVVVMTALFYGVVHAAAGFDYVDAFLTASRVENPEGYWLLADPVSWAGSRVGALLEIALLFSPVLCVALVPGTRRLLTLKPRVARLCLAALVALPAYLATGVLPTGEGARCCLFVAPLFFLAVAACLAEASARRWAAVGFALAGQSVLFQHFASFVF
jgi:hypothetical protein